jgi:hypothetical protein
MASPRIDLTAQINPHSAVILSSRTEIGQLKDSVRRLMPERDSTLDPGFFLASTTEAWMPRVVVVSRGNAIVGVVYAKERRIVGIPIGVVYADGVLGNMVVADLIDQENVLTVAIQALFAARRVRGVRLAIPPNGPELRSAANIASLLLLDVGYSRINEGHARLPLPDGYEKFLQSVGYKTRRNFRYYRRQFEAAGHTYIEKLSMDEMRHAARDLAPKCSIPSPPIAIQRALNMLTAVERPLAVGLKHRNGEWLSIAGGWYGSDRVTMQLQLNNDRDYWRASLSVVLRANLIEMLIRQSIPELVFWTGTAPPLSRYVSPIPAIGMYLDTPSPGWRMIRSLIAKTVPWIPRQIAKDVRWIASSELWSRPPSAGATGGNAH